MQLRLDEGATNVLIISTDVFRHRFFGNNNLGLLDGVPCGKPPALPCRRNSSTRGHSHSYDKARGNMPDGLSMVDVFAASILKWSSIFASGLSHRDATRRNNALDSCRPLRAAANARIWRWCFRIIICIRITIIRDSRCRA